MATFIKQFCRLCTTQCLPNCCNQGLTPFLDTSGTTNYSFSLSCPGGWPEGGTVLTNFDAVTVKDRLTVNADGVTIWDTLCISGAINVQVNIPNNTNMLTLFVDADCDRTGDATVWYLSAYCTQKVI